MAHELVTAIRLPPEGARDITAGAVGKLIGGVPPPMFLGRVEMKPFMKALNLSASRNMEEYLNLKKAALSMFGPDLVDYEIKILDHQSYEMHFERCFAHENIMRAGIKDQYECGIFSRLQGWIDAQGLNHELTPALGKCMKVLGKECCYTLKLQFN